MSAEVRTRIRCDHIGTDGPCDTELALDMSPDRTRHLLSDVGWGRIAPDRDLCPQHSRRRPPYTGHYTSQREEREELERR